MGLNLVLSILVLAAIALILGAFLLWRHGGQLNRIVLMLVLAAVMIVNVAIWTLPDASGEAPLDKVENIDQEAG
jgi:ABC-type transport system involved in cytochrome c biogenesis permease subunit